MSPHPAIAAPARPVAPAPLAPGILEQVYRMPLADYQRATELGTLPENVELLRGVVVAKIFKSPLHESIVSRLTRLMLRRLPEDLALRLGAPLTLGDSEPEPDLAVVEARADDWRTAHPATAFLVVEVSINSLRLDLEKALLYAEGALPEYWLVQPAEQSVLVHRDPVDGVYRSVQRLGMGDQLSALRFDFSVTLRQLFT